MTIAHGALRRAGAALLAVASMTLVACAGPGVQSIPESSKGRLSQLAERLPASSEASLYMTDLNGLSAGIKRASAAYGEGSQGGLVELQAELNDKFGIDLADPGSWRDAAGIAPGGGLAFGFTGNRSVMLAYVENAEMFDSFMSTKVRDEAGIEGEAVETKVGDVVVKVLGANVEQQVAWTHFGKLAIVASPQLDPEKGGEADIATFVAGIYNNDKAASTSTSAAFKQFSAEFGGKYLVAAFANPEAFKTSAFYPEFKQEFEGEEGGEETLQNFEKYCTSLGFGFDLSGDVITSHAFFGGNAEFAEYYEDLAAGVADATFTGFATSSLIAMGRVSINFAAGLALTEKFATREAWEEFQSGLAEASRELGFDVKAVVLDQLTGNFATFFYGVDLAQAMGGGGLGAAQLAAVTQFKSPEAALDVLNKFVAAYNANQAKNAPAVDPLNPDAAAAAAPTPLAVGPMGAGQGVTIPNAGSIIATGDLLVFAAGALDPSQVDLYAKGKGGELLSTPLGKPFASGPAHGGLYINIEQLGLLVGPLVQGNPEAAAVFSNFRDAAITFDSSKRGVSGTFELELLPKQ
jgi:hypothetical protein